jgi:hypothetical protein
MNERVRTVGQEERGAKRTVENWGGVQQEEGTYKKDDNPSDTDE